MSSSVKRLGLLAGLPALLAGAIALAQDRAAGEAPGQSRADVFNPVEGRGLSSPAGPMVHVSPKARSSVSSIRPT